MRNCVSHSFLGLSPRVFDGKNHKNIRERIPLHTVHADSCLGQVFSSKSCQVFFLSPNTKDSSNASGSSRSKMMQNGRPTQPTNQRPQIRRKGRNERRTALAAPRNKLIAQRSNCKRKCERASDHDPRASTPEAVNSHALDKKGIPWEAKRGQAVATTKPLPRAARNGRPNGERLWDINPWLTTDRPLKALGDRGSPPRPQMHSSLAARPAICTASVL